MQPLILQDMPPLHCGSVQHPCFCASRPDKHLWKLKVFGACVYSKQGERYMHTLIFRSLFFSAW